VVVRGVRTRSNKGLAEFEQFGQQLRNRFGVLLLGSQQVEHERTLDLQAQLAELGLGQFAPQALPPLVAYPSRQRINY
jgi:hypothetical protein